jgi:hypothetical protein
MGAMPGSLPAEVQNAARSVGVRVHDCPLLLICRTDSTYVVASSVVASSVLATAEPMQTLNPAQLTRLGREWT